MKLDQQLAVSEIFGPTIQGEGPSSGQQAMFLRLSMCNLKCVWCDTKYTWDWEHYSKAEESHLMTLAKVDFRLLKSGPELLVITGGEPLLQQKHLIDLSALYYYPRIEIETNGTIEPCEQLMHNSEVHFNVSPKLEHSGNPIWSTQRGIQSLKLFAQLDRAIFKFVCQTEDDLDEVRTIQDLCNISDEQVWIMPEGNNVNRLLERTPFLATKAIDQGWNFTTRQHVLIWGNKRGV